MTPKRALTFSPAAQEARNEFRRQWGGKAGVCLDWMDRETCRDPEAGRLIGDNRFARISIVPAKDGSFRCWAVYIFNDAAVKWLLFHYLFIPVN